jgi:hypothetical protein
LPMVHHAALHFFSRDSLSTGATAKTMSFGSRNKERRTGTRCR